MAALTDDQLMEMFIRVVDTPKGTRLECKTIYWPDAATPASRWVAAMTFPKSMSGDFIENARRGLLLAPRFFGVCKMCHERNPVGWMQEKDLCQGCAERHLGYIY